MRKELVELDINAITVKSRVRSSNGDITTLQNSIQKLGLLCPIIVDRNRVLISGARRLDACRTIGMTTVAALKVDIDHNTMTALDIQSDDNLCREGLSNEDLEKLIRMKKSMIGRKQPGNPGFFKRIMNFFTGKN